MTMLKKFLIINFFLFLLLFGTAVFASSTSGTIDSANKYAWGENIGWINFGAEQGNAAITDSAATGYVWSENYGWINLAPATSGVRNNGEGSLSGYAWGEKLGWINFSGVTINSSGEFSGYAEISRDNSRISFNCSNTGSCAQSDFKVKTDWRPRSSRPACNNSTDDDNDGKTDYPDDSGCSSLIDTNETDSGAINIAMFNNPSAPSGEFSVLIEGDREKTEKREIFLNLKGGSDTAYVWLSESSSFSENYKVDYDRNKNEIITTYILSDGEGIKIVYAKFCNQWGRCSDIVSDSIEYLITKKESSHEDKKPKEDAKANEKKQEAEEKKESEKSDKEQAGEKITEKIKNEKKEQKKDQNKILEKLIDKMKDFLGPVFPFLKQKPIEPVDLEKLLPKEAPKSLAGKWNLLTEKSVKQFVFSPLPQEIRKLAAKFPELKNTFDKVGIAKVSDIVKLKSLKLNLPGLTEAAGMPKTKLQSGKLAIPEGIPLADLPNELKQRLPTEIIFAKAGKELIDFNIVLSINNQGKPQQKITAIAKGPLKLAVKVEGKVESVKGFLVFKSKSKSVSVETINTADNLFRKEHGIASQARNDREKHGIASQARNDREGHGIASQARNDREGHGIASQARNDRALCHCEERTSEASERRSNPEQNALIRLLRKLAMTKIRAAFAVKEAQAAEGGLFNDITYKLQDLISPLIFAKPSFAFQQTESVKVEDELVLIEFEYEDSDGDGIYTAEIKAPAVEGEYEIITLISYKDPDLGIRAIRLTTVIDPEGYIFEKYKDKEMRVPGAVASLYWFNPEIKQYEIWPAEKYNQENPQITDASGKYSFLTPQGNYYLKVEASGYLPHEGKPFAVKEGEGIHFNIELKTKYWWLKNISWQTVLLAITLLLLGYNFYKDRIREKN